MSVVIELIRAGQKHVRLMTRIEVRQLCRLLKGSQWSQKLQSKGTILCIFRHALCTVQLHSITHFIVSRIIYLLTKYRGKMNILKFVMAKYMIT